ncbi:hypothetical protein K5I29_04540 [Flavobacterium agricola]|uniref:Uncharacterized protein n=1 Tax=Flavobacterium agricola TaxID=2870839 RepID=A0ABY6M169_9FLAO|nr:hypothetical protein [Flavobacterium agricola]UYW02176.1 hypothetical protein K5I29_04540 [Flavobacterium agricola]
MKKFFGTLVALYWGIGAMAQVGINTTTPDQSSILDISSSNSGILIPQIYLTDLFDKSTIKNGNPKKSLLIFNTNSTLKQGDGYYYWDGSMWVKMLNTGDAGAYTADNGITMKGTEVVLGGNINQDTNLNITDGGSLAISGLPKNGVQQNNETLIALDANNVMKALKAAMPKFFYMPSIVVPTHADYVPTGETLGKIDLYSKYQSQFGAPKAKNASATTSLPVLAKNELDYYITWYDENVFTNVQVDNNGVLTYSIKSNADVTASSFMNIVFAVKP